MSCLAVASKVLERIVCDQITRFMEVHGLLPDNQHGFREKRSTMTALSEMQREWSNSTEQKQKTGILLWDLSAAYDTLDCELLCQKLKIYGFSEKACCWMRSFLTGRTQKVKVGDAISTAVTLETGVPQGGILSPVIFIIYGADFELWLKYSSAFAYADDSSTSISDNDMEEIKLKLQEDAENVLDFMASNGLVANPNKTVYMILGDRSAHGNKHRDETIRVGTETIQVSKKTKLLGVDIDENQKWSTHIHNVVGALDRRLFQIRRMSNQISEKGLRKITDSLWTSKLRYGLQLCATVRTNENQPKNTEVTKLQKAQNRMLRVLTKTKRLERKRITDMLKETQFLSVNQTSAQIKLTEMWKATKDEKYPIKVEVIREKLTGISTRRNQSTQIKETGRTNVVIHSFVGDAARLWNNAPDEIKNTKTISRAKQAIRKYVKTLPV